MSDMNIDLSVDPRGTAVAVIGAGTMGAGIAQIAAQACHPVLLHDAREGSAAQAIAKIGDSLATLVAKGRLDASARAATLDRLRPAASLDALAPCALLVEAIVEDLGAKRALFKQLESIAGERAILATNTSSISVTAIANGLARPERLAGLHFFNPVPLMRLVEVVSGLSTAPAVSDALMALARAWGKTPVHASSTPGFIVNRIARPYYAEALALLHERYATPAEVDAALRGAGFRMGPCELMDLIGHDVNFAVTSSVFSANFGDKRYAPSLVQQALVDGGLLGRKSGRGFYAYRDGQAVDALPAAGDAAAVASAVTEIPSELGLLRLQPTDGRPAAQVAVESGHAAVAVYDWMPERSAGAALAVAFAPGCREAQRAAGLAAIAAAGRRPLPVGDAPGLIVARTLAMLVNEACDALQQGVCDEAAADTAMKLGVNYPAGPFEWLQRLGAAPIVALIEQLDRQHRGERYRVSPALRQRVWTDAE